MDASLELVPELDRLSSETALFCVDQVSKDSTNTGVVWLVRSILKRCAAFASNFVSLPGISSLSHVRNSILVGESLIVAYIQGQ